MCFWWSPRISATLKYQRQPERASSLEVLVVFASVRPVTSCAGMPASSRRFEIKGQPTGGAQTGQSAEVLYLVPCQHFGVDFAPYQISLVMDAVFVLLAIPFLLFYDRTVLPLLFYCVLPCVVLKSFCIEYSAKGAVELAVGIAAGAGVLLLSMAVSWLFFRKAPWRQIGTLPVMLSLAAALGFA